MKILSGSPEKIAPRCIFGGLIFFLIFSFEIGVLSANYRFAVPENHCIVKINKDASIEIEYNITFENDGDSIDVIDVGLPDKQYNLGDVRADIDGNLISDIRKSTYLASGVEVHPGEWEIRKGSKATLHLTARALNRVFYDSNDKKYASMEFSPTWYGGDYTFGNTHLTLKVIFPEGIQSDEVRYHGTSFTDSGIENGMVYYIWDIQNAMPSSQYTFGVSFPARVMEHIEKPPAITALLSRLIVGIFGLLFRSAFCVMISVFTLFSILSFFKNRWRMMKYLPATVGMEGVEVRRGLTVPEVAALMEERVDRVMALILFGMVRKGIIKVAGRNPLKLEVIPDVKPEYSYEEEFVKSVKNDGRIDETEASKVLIDLIKRVGDKMKGFNRKKSIAYYKDIIRRAWEQVGKESYSESFEWLLLDKDLEKNADTYLGGGNIPIPIWWTTIFTGHSSTGASGGSAPMQSPVSIANNIVTGIENFGHDLANSIPGLSSKVTTVTNPPPVSSYHGSASGSGGCACACACAGCACACAGGGR